jgi:lipoteichoic acid synthase
MYRLIIYIDILLIWVIGFSGCKITSLNRHRIINDVFIAHAGGEIDSLTYTNSLEALNLSYSKGYRLFELDIIETSDGQLVAAHDWKHFKQITNFPYEINDTPLTEHQFLTQRIYNKYTPINMDRINKWFSLHKDAILVTDKINFPKKMSEEFLFKDRLRMELFSWDAVIEAINLGVTPMPSECLVFDKDAENKLYSLKISYVAISRRLIEANKVFLTRLKAHNIKTYVYHLNFDSGKDENYVLKNEMDYIYGMYADHLDFIR